MIICHIDLDITGAQCLCAQWWTYSHKTRQAEAITTAFLGLAWFFVVVVFNSIFIQLDRRITTPYIYILHFSEISPFVFSP